MKFQSTKVIDGFSCCFRQEKAFPINCAYIHGYSISFKIVFEGDLDTRQWVVDYGFLKRSNNCITWDNKAMTPDEWFKYMFDHTVIVSSSDSQLDWFKEADKKNILRLRIIPYVGCERFAELVFNAINPFIQTESEGRVHVVSVECMEHNKNSSIFLS